ncbi:conserved protein, unknown function, partial [Hepatocystis sp. ex Piliocolobus tephrosceles]
DNIEDRFSSSYNSNYDDNAKKNIRSHSSPIIRNPLIAEQDYALYNDYIENVFLSRECYRNIQDLAKESNFTTVSDNITDFSNIFKNTILFHNSFFTKAYDFDNDDIPEKNRIVFWSEDKEAHFWINRYNPRFLFSVRFFLDMFANIFKVGRVNYIHELLVRDDDIQIGHTILNNIIDNAYKIGQNYFYIDRHFLDRHAQNVIRDDEYDFQQHLERNKNQYLDVPCADLKKVMLLESIDPSDDIDIDDESECIDVKSIENYYYYQTVENPEDIENKSLADIIRDLENGISLLDNITKETAKYTNKNTQSFTENIESKKDSNDSEETEELIKYFEKIKLEKDEFFNNIPDKPVENKIYERKFTLNEQFLLTGATHVIRYNGKYGPVHYLPKTEDDNYIYRMIELLYPRYQEALKDFIDKKKKNEKLKDDAVKPKHYIGKPENPEKLILLDNHDITYGLGLPMGREWTHCGYLNNDFTILIHKK